MTTLIMTGFGGIGGRCDAKCYNATHPKCDCICGRANHGKGLVGALKATEEVCKENLRAAGREHLADELIIAKERALNLDLFGGEGGKK